MEKILAIDIEKNIINDSLFICSSSFEKRCLIIPNEISKNKSIEAVICYFPNNYVETEKNTENLKNLFLGRYSTIELSFETPLDNYDKLFDKLTINKKEHIYVDVSTFTRETLLIIIKILSLPMFEATNIHLCYCPSSRYSSYAEGTSLPWLSKGVRIIRSVVGYSGDMSPIKDLLLIILVGFEYERAQTLIEVFEPNKLYLGMALPTDSHNKLLSEINLRNFDKLLEKNSQSIKFQFSCKKMEQNIEEISRIVDENINDYNIVISPMNNKLSTLSIAAIAQKYPEVQICYALANQYNTESYSYPEDFIYVLSLNEIMKNNK